MTHTTELEFIHYLHQFRTPYLDHFFKLLNFFDRPEFFIILIPTVWLVNGWRPGLRLFYILLLSNLANDGLKTYFSSPRPFHLDPTLGIIQVTGLGFPSGAAQTVILLSGILITYWRTYWKWAIGFAYLVLISFSRIYLGIHFPSDILGGWLIGFFLWSVYRYVFPYIEKQSERMPPITLLILSQALPLFFLHICHYSLPATRICGIGMGISMGLFITYSYQLFLPPPKNSKESILRAVVGTLGAFICYGMALLLPTSPSIISFFPRFLLIGLWLGLGSHIICRKLFLDRNAFVEIN